MIKFLYFFKTLILLANGKKLFDLYFTKFLGYLKILAFKLIILCVGLNFSV